MLPFILWLMMMYSDLQCYVLCVMLMYSCLCSITTRLRSCAGRRTETTTPSWGASCSTLASPSRTPATTTSPTSTSSETTRLYWRYSGNTTQKLTGPGTFYKNPSTRESLHKWNKRLRFITDEIAILITTQKPCFIIVWASPLLLLSLPLLSDCVSPHPLSSLWKVTVILKQWLYSCKPL